MQRVSIALTKHSFSALILGGATTVVTAQEKTAKAKPAAAAPTSPVNLTQPPSPTFRPCRRRAATAKLIVGAQRKDWRLQVGRRVDEHQREIGAKSFLKLK
jgi:hypothetical protein